MERADLEVRVSKRKGDDSMSHIKSIDVFKNVIITDEYAAGEARFGSQDYLNITSVEGDSKDGFVNAVFAFDSDQDCCEVFGTEFSNGLYGEHYVTRIHIFETEEPPEDGYYDDVYGSLTVVLDVLEPESPMTRTNKRTKYQWKCYNHHNGYYGHSIDVEVSEDGQKTFDYSNVY